jgi:hypothetical protein
MRLLLVAERMRTTMRHVDSALTSGSRIARGTGGAGGGGIALESSFSVFTGLVTVLVAVEPFRARGLGAMMQTVDDWRTKMLDNDRYEGWSERSM